MNHYEVALQGLGELWVEEYSRGRDRFRCWPMKEVLSSNIRRAGRRDANSWALIAIGTRDHLDLAIKVIQDAQTILGCSRNVISLLPRLEKGDG